MLFVVLVLVGWCVFLVEGSIVVGLGEVGSMGCCRIGSAGVVLWMVEGVGWPDYLTLSSCFVLSWTTKLALWRNSTMLECSCGNLLVGSVSATFLQKFGGTDLDERELVTGTF